MELATGQAIQPGKTLLFIDAIPACPQAVTALRHFHEELPFLHVVAAGSLLDFSLAEVSVPVGRVSYPEMHPLTFQEHPQAIGNEPAAATLTRGPRSLEPPIHDMLLTTLTRFLFVGDMPKCVAVAAGGGTL